MTVLCDARTRDVSVDPNRLVLFALAAVMVVVASAVILLGPILTNDGPVHVAFAHLMAGDPAAVLQSAVYRAGEHRVTNVFAELLMNGLMTVVSPRAAESILQVLCFVAPIAAGVFCLAAIDRRNTWLAVLLLPLSLNEMFFLGLYNFSLSTAAFLVAVGLHLRLSGRYGFGGAIAIVAVLLAAFLLHPAGFVAAWVCLAAMTAGAVVSRAIAGTSLGEALLERASVWISLGLAAVVVVLLGDPAGGGDAVLYGRSPTRRLLYFVSASSLASTEWQLVLTIPFMLLLLAITVVGVRGRLASAPWTVFAEERAPSVFAGFLASILLMMVFPDSIGGGWTHFRRFVLFPYPLVVANLALLPYSRRWIVGGAAGAIIVFLGLAGDDFRHQSKAREQIGAADAIDRAIGAHCTVLPIVLDRGPVDDDGREIDLKYQPYFQFFSRLETRDDRVVLFNYLARLDVYPIRYTATADPHETLFGWRHHQQETRIETLDVDAYERDSDLHVDYVLLLGHLDGRSEALRAGVAKALAGSTRILTDDDGRITLHRRLSGGGRSRCEAAPVAGRATEAVTLAGHGKST